MVSTYAWAAIAMFTTAAGIATFLARFIEHIPSLGFLSPTLIGGTCGILFVLISLYLRKRDGQSV